MNLHIINGEKLSSDAFNKNVIYFGSEI